MGVILSSDERLAPLEGRGPTVTTVCSHSSLQIFHGARAEGLATLGIAIGKPPRFYDAFPRARPDRFLSVDRHSNVPALTERLQQAGAVLVPHGSFVEYLGPEAFGKLDVPVFGNRDVLGWESDRRKEREWLEGAGV